MKAYYLVSFISLIIQWILPSKTDNGYRWRLFFTFLPLFIFGAIRVDFGLDYESYEKIYYSLHGYSQFEYNDNYSVEVGYQWLNHIMPSFRWILVLNAFLLSFALGLFCYHNVPKNYLFLAIILIFLNPEKNIFGSLVGIRNGLVVTSFLIGFVLVQKRKLVPFILLTILLTTIHRSALLFMPIAYLVAWNKPLSKAEIYIWVFGILALLLLGASGIADVLDYILSNPYLDRYEGYVKRGKTSGFLMVSSSLLLLYAFMTILYNSKDFLTKKENSTIRMGMLYLASNLMGSLAGRASYFYDMFFIVSSVLVFANKRINQMVRLAVVLFAIAMSAYSMFYVWLGNMGNVYKIYHSLLGDW